MARVVAESAPDARASRRDRSRRRRSERFLAIGLDLVCAEGLDALTMQRLASEADTAVGTVYRYFPSKGALLAEIERSAVERLGASLAALLAEVDALDALDEATHAAVGLLAPGRWLCSAAVVFPNEVELLQRLMSDWSRVIPIEETHRVLPAVFAVLDLGRVRVAAASSLGLIGDADPLSRVVTQAAALGGTLGVTKVGVFAPDLLDGHSLSRQLADDIVRGWGLDPDLHVAASAVLDDLAAAKPLGRTPESPGVEPPAAAGWTAHASSSEPISPGSPESASSVPASPDPARRPL